MVSERITKDQVRAMVARTDKEKPKPADLAEMRTMLDQLLAQGGALTTSFDAAEDGLIDYMSSGKAFTMELLRREQDARRKGLGYAAAPLLEKMLIDCVALAWLRYTDAERRYTTVTGQDHAPAIGLHWERRVSAAQHRYLRAVETLARVRKLAVGVLQINVAGPGGQQANQVIAKQAKE